MTMSDHPSIAWAEDPEHYGVDLPDDLRAVAPVYGMCTGCGSVEVRLNARTGTRDLSAMGESSKYPTGYGCEVCS